MRSSSSYVWQRPSWPQLKYDHPKAGEALMHARRMQGVVEGAAKALGIEPDGHVVRSTFEEEVLATAAIEGEKLDPQAVRSSVMRRLGLAAPGPHDRSIEGLVDVINDASMRFDCPLDVDRLCRWHAALFPGGTSGIKRIAVGRYRDHHDPMQIVSGRPGKEVVHYEAPPSHLVLLEMDRFFEWFAMTAPTQAKAPRMDGLARAAIAHLWFVTIHPFEDGNGRIGRAIVDLALAQDLNAPVRLVSLSRQLLHSRADYYRALNAAQCGEGDVTDWVVWFVQQYAMACQRSATVIDQAMAKSKFWSAHASDDLNDRQRKVLQRLLDAGDGGFLGGLTAQKYIRMVGTSKPSATRDLSAMVKMGVLRSTGQGKATRYQVNVPNWNHGLGTEDQVEEAQPQAGRPRERD